MKVTLKADSKVAVNGIEMVLEKGTGVELSCQSDQEALEMCTIAKLDVDFSYTEKGVKYIEGASGKFIAVPVVVKPKAEPKVEKPKAPKAEAKPKAKK